MPCDSFEAQTVNFVIHVCTAMIDCLPLFQLQLVCKEQHQIWESLLLQRCPEMYSYVGLVIARTTCQTDTSRL